ncbi:MAG TPA: extracellular solute-binding protein [Oligoflexus sp.]|uniref:ABC transporter substrate-binding protein n=1 Tax=Oligoflexus sp. TaxID=1971216 RepID=UPI002D7F4CD7|nr:extracellular solute-binding protein [Oligoflexus sp.]HET9240090.1 extracellular solute-binding protein [Oligoflexus sp.]
MNRRTLLQSLAMAPFAWRGWAREGLSPEALSQNPTVKAILEKARNLRSRSKPGLRLFYPKGSLGNLLPCASIFEQGSGIKVQMIEASLDEIASQLMLEHRLNRSEPYDVALPPTYSIPDLAAAGVIAPLNNWAKQHEAADSFSSCLYKLGNRFLDQLYGYQADGDAYLFFMNRSWLEDPKYRARYEDRFGQRLDIPKTWEEVDRQLQFFHEPDRNRFGGSLFRTLQYTVWEFWIRLHAKGIWPFDANMNPQIEQAASVEALRELIRATNFLAGDVKQNGLFENFRSYGEGNTYCNLGWGGTQKYLQSPASRMRNQVIHSPMPGGKIGSRVVPMPYFNWGWNYVVLERSQQKELAYLFCLFASTVAISTLSIRDRDGYFDPVRLEHYEDPTIISIYSQDFLKAHRESLENVIPDLYIQGYNLYMSALKHAIHSCIMYDIKPEMALKKVTQRWNELTDKVGREAQIKQWRYLRSCYPPYLQTMLR